jgi:hypothetical protein
MMDDPIMRGEFGQAPCADCGDRNVTAQAKYPLVPVGTVTLPKLCEKCLELRIADFATSSAAEQKPQPRPLGERPPLPALED